jgi:hypothetical protein
MPESIYDALFLTGRARSAHSVPIATARPYSAVMLNHSVETVPIPLGIARSSALVVLCGNLAQYDVPEVISTILSLPRVVTPAVAEHGSIQVPLIEPDEVTADGLTWNVTPELRVRESRIGRADLEVHRDPGIPRLPIVELAARQWWQLARVLTSVAAWRLHVAEQCLELADQARRQLATELRARNPRSMRVFHLVDGNAVVEVYAYQDTESATDQDALDSAFRTFNAGADPEISEPNTHAMRYRFFRNRSLSPGDVVACGDNFYRYTGSGWDRIPQPATTKVKVPGTTPWEG